MVGICTIKSKVDPIYHNATHRHQYQRFTTFYVQEIVHHYKIVGRKKIIFDIGINPALNLHNDKERNERKKTGQKVLCIRYTLHKYTVRSTMTLALAVAVVIFLGDIFSRIQLFRKRAIRIPNLPVQ